MLEFGNYVAYSQAKELVGDRDPRSHEFSVQLQAMDTDRSGYGLGLPVLVALPNGEEHQSDDPIVDLDEPGDWPDAIA